ncbi:MAG: type II restriction endonuclease [Flavobacteriales bacterium]|nr:type II restriction endonuclease [Flavobacteriales bacterium]
MQPLGRFFQVTETLDVKKYFLDIDKIERYPISFVIKSEASIADLKAQLKRGAEKQYGVKAVVDKYMACIEEVINIEVLQERFRKAVKDGHLKGIIAEIVLQSKVEFNYEDEE